MCISFINGPGRSFMAYFYFSNGLFLSCLKKIIGKIPVPTTDRCTSTYGVVGQVPTARCTSGMIGQVPVPTAS